MVAETVDISFGDAWVKPYSTDGRGTNVVVVRTPAMEALVEAGIREGHLHLEVVDGEFVWRTQAAGLRQRREGLAYRLTWPGAGLRPRKRVAPDAHSLTVRRKFIYHMRALITAGSHRVFRLTRALRWPGLYVGWARASHMIYHGLAYGRGRLGRVARRFLMGEEG